MNKMSIKKGRNRMLTPTSLLHIISLALNISFTAEDARIYAFFFKFCSFRYDAATSVGKMISSCKKEMPHWNTAEEEEIINSNKKTRQDELCNKRFWEELMTSISQHCNFHFTQFIKWCFLNYVSYIALNDKLRRCGRKKM